MRWYSIDCMDLLGTAPLDGRITQVWRSCDEVQGTSLDAVLESQLDNYRRRLSVSDDGLEYPFFSRSDRRRIHFWKLSIGDAGGRHVPIHTDIDLQRNAAGLSA